MSTDYWSQVKEILDAAIRRPYEDRAAFLDEACKGDESVRREVESLLSSFGRADGFMEKPAIETDDQATTEELSLVPDGQVIQHYEVVRRIGTGGMGVVYLATDRKLDRLVAIKLLNRRFARSEENVRRFVQEAKAASALNHPNILTIYEIAEFEGSHCIVSEFVDGRTLREILASERPGLGNVIAIAAQIAGALAAAHKARIIHRDIKPENIVVREDGYVKILDFGLAKLLTTEVSAISSDDRTKRQNETARGVILGTVNYMSPEQAKGEVTDERTDIFSLGAVMYEMISGRTPFRGNSTAEAFANLLNKTVEPLERIVPGVPHGLSNVVSKMLESDRSKRYQSMQAVLADLMDLKGDRTTGSALLRVSSPDEENLTAAIPGATHDAASSALASSAVSKRAIRRVSLFAIVPILLIGALAVGIWFLYPTTTQPQIKTLAVLPFKSLDAGDNLLGFGIADAVIRRISQTGALTVRPTSAVRRYLTEDTDALTAAKDLAVNAVLEGTIQRTEDKVRITVNLLRSDDGASLWTEKYDAQFTELLAVQEKVALEVSDRLKVKLDSAQQERVKRQSTSNAEAYAYYTKAVFHFGVVRADFVKHPEQLDTAIEQFDQAIAIDPNYALAYAQRAYAYEWRAIFLEGDRSDIEKANESLRAAERIDPQLPDVHVARSFLLFSQYENWNVPGAIREIQMAQSLDPTAGHNELSELYVHLGLEDQWLREKKIAMEIDPTSDEIKNGLVNMLYLSMRTDEALEADRKYFGRGPDALYYLQKKMFKEAKPLIEEAIKADPNDPSSLDNQAILLAIDGKHRQADEAVRRMLPKLRKNRSYHHFTYDIACIYALAGNTDESLRWLRTTAAAGFVSYPLFQRDWAFDRIRNDPNFVAYMNEVREQWDRNNREFH